MKRSITLRLMMMFAAAALIIFSLVGISLYRVLLNELERHQREELHILFQDMAYMVEHIGSVDRWTKVQGKMEAMTPTDGSKRMWVLSDDPRFQYGHALTDIIQPARDNNEKNAIYMGNIQLRNRSYPLRTMAKIIAAYEQRPPVRLIVGIDTEPYFHTQRTFVIALVSLSLLGIVFVTLLGYWIAKVGLRPLKQLSNEAQTLNPRALSQRLPIAPLPDELSDLVNAFNGALKRMENAYQQLETFNADVAHELRTPLTNLIGTTQVALSRERQAAHFQDVLQSNLEELERMHSIVNDMLFLARADQGAAATGLVCASIAQEVIKTIEFFEFVLDESAITVKLIGDTTIETPIETALFRRAISNLLQNAIQHSKQNTQIVVNISTAPSIIQIAVSNQGATIPETHLQRLFDRFYRVDVARCDQELHGYGLGLAIVKAIAHMHGGTVFATCKDDQTTIGFSVKTVMNQ